VTNIVTLIERIELIPSVARAVLLRPLTPYTNDHPRNRHRCGETSTEFALSSEASLRADRAVNSAPKNVVRA
jgi:hypothetical protein